MPDDKKDEASKSADQSQPNAAPLPKSGDNASSNTNQNRVESGASTEQQNPNAKTPAQAVNPKPSTPVDRVAAMIKDLSVGTPDDHVLYGYSSHRLTFGMLKHLLKMAVDGAKDIEKEVKEVVKEL